MTNNEDLEKRLSEITEDEPTELEEVSKKATNEKSDQEDFDTSDFDEIMARDITYFDTFKRKIRETTSHIKKKRIPLLATTIGIITLAGFTYYKIPDIKDHLKQRRIEGYHTTYLELKADYEEIKEYRKLPGKGVADSLIAHGNNINKINKKIEELRDRIKEENNPELQQLYANICSLDKDMDTVAHDSLDNGHFFKNYDRNNR